MREQRLWTWHVLAGVIILVLLGLHMTIMHLETLVGVFLTADSHNPVNWVNVAARVRNPGTYDIRSDSRCAAAFPLARQRLGLRLSSLILALKNWP